MGWLEEVKSLTRSMWLEKTKVMMKKESRMLVELTRTKMNLSDESSNLAKTTEKKLSIGSKT